MSEKSTKLKFDDIKNSVATVYKIVDEECFVCGNEIEATGETENGLMNDLHNQGYKRLKSDHFGSIGIWCGCDYKEEIDFNVNTNELKGQKAIREASLNGCRCFPSMQVFGCEAYEKEKCLHHPKVIASLKSK